MILDIEYRRVILLLHASVLTVFGRCHTCIKNYFVAGDFGF